MLKLDVCTQTGIPKNILSPLNIYTKDKFECPGFLRLSERLLSLRKETGVDYKMYLDYLVAYLYDLF
jgi:hypothetical protein